MIIKNEVTGDGSAESSPTTTFEGGERTSS